MCGRDTKEPLLFFGIGGSVATGTDAVTVIVEFERGTGAGELLVEEGSETVSECDLMKPWSSLCTFLIVGLGIGGGRGFDGIAGLFLGLTAGRGEMRGLGVGLLCGGGRGGLDGGGGLDTAVVAMPLLSAPVPSSCVESCEADRCCREQAACLVVGTSGILVLANGTGTS